MIIADQGTISKKIYATNATIIVSTAKTRKRATNASRASINRISSSYLVKSVQSVKNPAKSADISLLYALHAWTIRF
jgi:hypothetical protein